MIITGFHAIEEQLRSGAGTTEGAKAHIMYDTAGPRIKKIIEDASKRGIHAHKVPSEQLNRACDSLSESARDHRGVVLVIEGGIQAKRVTVDFAQFIAQCIRDDAKEKTVILLDSITDPHNMGAIIRSCDQFGVDLVIIPDHGSANESEVIDRSSAGASAWVPLATVSNLVRASEQLKKAGFWIYGADASGNSLESVQRSQKTAIVMGSEGVGISRLLREKCDVIVSIPTQGKLDSLNVSVAAGILLYKMTQ